MKKSKVHITDHALIRYLERVWEVDVESLRRRIGREVDRNLLDGMPDPCGVKSGGVVYKLRDSTVTTCVAVKRPGRGKRLRK